MIRNEKVEVCVIGAGAAGAVAAKELGERGVSVVVLEAGRRYEPPKDYASHRDDWEVATWRVFQLHDPGSYTSAGEQPFVFHRVRGVGGTTLAYQMVSLRFHESDFQLRSRDGVGEDWPITYSDLEPYYEQVEIELGVSGLNENPWDVRRGPYPNPPHEFSCATKVIKRGCDALGIRVLHTPLASITRPYDGRPPCVHCCTCGTGCMIRAKSSTDVTYVPKAEATGKVEIRPNCFAREIEVDSHGRAKSVLYIDAEGVEQEQEAEVIVISASAIESVRLLLNSKSPLFPDGLANSSGLVGKYFMVHPSFYVIALATERVSRYKGIPVNAIIQDFYETNPQNDYVKGWTFYLLNGPEGPLTFASLLAPAWGRSHKDYMREYFGHTVAIAGQAECLPCETNTITLDPEVVDAYGMPVPRITLTFGANEKALHKAMMEKAVEILEVAGAEIVHGPYVEHSGAGHYMGGCRMGHDPSTSVLNPYCQAHDVPNLFVVDSGSFVTSSGVNPALTIQALATRAAEYIATEGRRGNL